MSLEKTYPPEYLEMLQKFRLIDDTLFAACLDGDTLSMALILNLIFGRDDLRVASVVTQRSAQNLYGRGVRFDVIAVDSAGKIYNCEVQRADAGAIPRRARFNQSLLDSHLLAKGTGFKELPETYIIFITEHDIFKAGLPLYHIGHQIFELGQPFDDGAHILYVNGECRDDSPLGKLMQDFFEADVTKFHYERLAERVDYFKSEQRGVNTMCELMEKFGERKMAEGEAKGRAEGKAEERLFSVRNAMEGFHVTAERAMEVLKVPMEERSKLLKALSA